MGHSAVEWTIGLSPAPVFRADSEPKSLRLEDRHGALQSAQEPATKDKIRLFLERP